MEERERERRKLGVFQRDVFFALVGRVSLFVMSRGGAPSKSNKETRSARLKCAKEKHTKNEPLARPTGQAIHDRRAQLERRARDQKDAQAVADSRCVVVVAAAAGGSLDQLLDLGDAGYGPAHQPRPRQDVLVERLVLPRRDGVS